MIVPLLKDEYKQDQVTGDRVWWIDILNYFAFIICAFLGHTRVQNDVRQCRKDINA